MLVLRRVLDQFCEENHVSHSDPLAIAAAQELMRLWQEGDPSEEQLISDIAHIAATRMSSSMPSEVVSAQM